MVLEISNIKNLTQVEVTTWRAADFTVEDWVRLGLGEDLCVRVATNFDLLLDDPADGVGRLIVGEVNDNSRAGTPVENVDCLGIEMVNLDTVDEVFTTLFVSDRFGDSECLAYWDSWLMVMDCLDREEVAEVLGVDLEL